MRRIAQLGVALLGIYTAVSGLASVGHSFPSVLRMPDVAWSEYSQAILASLAGASLFSVLPGAALVWFAAPISAWLVREDASPELALDPPGLFAIGLGLIAVSSFLDAAGLLALGAAQLFVSGDLSEEFGEPLRMQAWGSLSRGFVLGILAAAVWRWARK
jgi:hypothetical protein